MNASDLALIGVTPESVAAVFSWGLASVLALWLTGYIVSIGLAIVRKV